MRRLGTAFIWLEHVRHRTRSDVLEFVILLLGIPVFEASHFCFKRAYAFSLRRIRLAGLDRLFEGLQHDTLHRTAFILQQRHFARIDSLAAGLTFGSTMGGHWR
jgi:hypothetical protein